MCARAGPTIRTTTGIQNLIRFNNFIGDRGNITHDPKRYTWRELTGKVSPPYIELSDADLIPLNEKTREVFPSHAPCGLSKDDSRNHNEMDHQVGGAGWPHTLAPPSCFAVSARPTRTHAGWRSRAPDATWAC